jgi:glycosyltransferase involved in cell wall biosynthesis
VSNKISVTILTKNSQKYIEECLFSLIKFDEVIVLDNGSDDKTIQIAEKFKNVVIKKSEFIGFGPLKQLAVSYASHDWILSVDSDEIFSKELVNEILSLELDEDSIYSILRDNYYNKKLIRCCGWDNDYVERLFNKHRVNFNDKQVHEGLIISNKCIVKKLENSFKHYTFDIAEELLYKLNKYSTLYAKENRVEKKSSAFIAFFKATFSFFKNYILQKGFLYGYEGLLISVSNANGVFYKYIKLYEENKR